MRVIIAGSRHIINASLVEDAIKESGFDISYLINGCCPTGVDALAMAWGVRHGVPTLAMPARWDEEGRSAGPKRNARMAAEAEALILVWDGKSRGSASMLYEAKMRGLKIYEKVIGA